MSRNINIQKGKAIQIYQDYITELDYEGLAFPVSRIKKYNDPYGTELWKVRFVKDLDNKIVERKVRTLKDY